MFKLLIAVDGSQPALDAVRHGIALVQQGLSAEFVLANVQTNATLYELVVARDAEVLRRVAQEAGTHLLQPAQALAAAAHIVHECVVAIGDPGNTLIELAAQHGCQEVLVGAHGHGKLSGALMGSVSQHLVHHSPVPVTVVKPSNAG